MTLIELFNKVFERDSLQPRFEGLSVVRRQAHCTYIQISA